MSVVFLNCKLLHSSSSVWQVERSPGKWKTLNLEWSTWLEDAWRNNAEEVVLEDKEVREIKFQVFTSKG